MQGQKGYSQAGACWEKVNLSLKISYNDSFALYIIHCATILIMLHQGFGVKI